MRKIRQSAPAPGGKPNVLFAVPSMVGYPHKGIPVNPQDLAVVQNTLGIRHHPVCHDAELHELLLTYVRIHDLTLPNCADTAVDFYTKLLHYLEDDGFQV